MVGRAGAQAAYLLRMHGLQKLDAALGAPSGVALAVLVVKGAALAMTHYARPWERAMVDIDFVVRPGSRGRVLSALPSSNQYLLNQLGESVRREVLARKPCRPAQGDR